MLPWLGRVLPTPAHQVAAIVGDALLRGDGRLVAVLMMDGPARAGAGPPAFLFYLGHALAVLDEEVTCSLEFGHEPLAIGPWCALHAAATAAEPHPRLRRLAAHLRGFLRLHAAEGLTQQRRCLIALAVPGGPSRLLAQRPITLPTAVSARLDAQVERLIQQMTSTGIALTRLDGAALALLVNQRLQPGQTARAQSRVSHLDWRRRPAVASSD